MALAHDILKQYPLYMSLVSSIVGPVLPDESKISEHAGNKTCFACHGTEIKVEGTRTVSTPEDDYEFPNLVGWPNQGVGRINPDGSKGACTACHPRHSFSLKVARKPYTCGQCHLAPDVPAYNVYKESKHGNIVASEGDKYNWDAVPWVVGRDFRSPTCATCHNALVTDQDGGVIAERTQDFAQRLWLRIFGLPYSHPQPVNGETWKLRNRAGQTLPVDLADGKPAPKGLIDAKEQQRRRGNMEAICGACHGTDWSQKFLNDMEEVARDADKSVKAATALMTQAWEKGVADNKNLCLLSRICG